MKKLQWIGCALVLALVLPGCNENSGTQPVSPVVSEGESTPAIRLAEATATPVSAASPTGTIPTLAETLRAEPSPSVVPAEEKAARIWLVQEPRIQSPVTTSVGMGPEVLQVAFAEAMDRQHVEKAIKSNMERAFGNAVWDKLTYSFQWENDQLLKLAVRPTGTEGPRPPGGSPRYAYSVNLEGARTQSGKTLGDGYFLHAEMLESRQLWRISLKDGSREQLSDFTEPYYVSRDIPVSGNTAFLQRGIQYCYCDMSVDLLSFAYGLETGELASYPATIMNNYQGEGDFYADTRGFFFAAPAAGEKVPSGGETVRIRPGGYIWGSAWSKDQRRIIMARGSSKEQVSGLDLIVYDRETGEEVKLVGAVKEELGDREVSSAKVPVSFYTDREYAYFSLPGKGSEPASRYRYEWDSQVLSPWNPPVEQSYYWLPFKDSSDGQYRLYGEGSLYRDGELVTRVTAHNLDAYRSSWLPDTRKLVSVVNDGQSLRLLLYDADQGTEQLITDRIGDDAELAGVSKDGQWVYLFASQRL
ncbi:MAG: hypothetical protein K0R57_2917 [Paenibacillaceae bacterium]|jgi:hypothetical protein|nr:hypothetical protein [Paenibacillaceae bacterium]